MIYRLKTKYSRLPLSVKAAVWFFICAFLQKAIAAITVPIFTRVMSSAQFGEYNVFLSWQSIINCVVTLNLYGGFYTQGLTKFADKRAEFSSSLQGLTIALLVIWVVLYWLCRELINHILSVTTVRMMFMFLSLWAASCFSFWSVDQRVQYQYKKLVIVTAISSVCIPLVGVISVMLSTDKVTARIAATAIVSLFCYGGLCISQLVRGKQFFSREFWPYALRFAVPLVPHYLSQIVLSNSDRIMIANLAGNSEAGIYSLAYQISQLMLLFNTALLQTIEPWIYKRIKNDETEEIQGIAFPMFIFIAILNLLLIAFAPEIVYIFSPAEYYEAIWVMPPITMSVFFMFQYSFFALFEFYYEKTKHIAFATMAGAILNVMLNYIFIKKYGYYAAGYTTLICYVLYVLMHFFFMKGICRKYHPGKKVYDTKILIILSGIFILLGFGLMLTYHNVILRFSFLLCTAAVVAIKWRYIFQYVKHLANIRKQ